MQDTNALSNLTNAVKGFFDCDVLPEVWFICGYTVATMQRKAVMEKELFFPQLNVFGDGEKTIAAKVGASLVGMHDEWNIVAKFNDMDVYEIVSRWNGVVQILDDPDLYTTQDSRSAIDNFIWSVSTGASRVPRDKGLLQPTSNCIITSNQPLGGDNPAIASRLIKLHIPNSGPVDGAGLPALEQAMESANSTLPILSAIQYDRSACEEIESKLLKHLVGADRRVPSAIALIVYFTQKFCDAAGVDFSAFDYAATHLCSTYID